MNNADIKNYLVICFLSLNDVLFLKVAGISLLHSTHLIHVKVKSRSF